MTQTTTSRPQTSILELPATAPRIRITAGVGSATQKTWNLKRPVTVIGSHRPAHIVLHDRDISHAHCVIVNTGSAVLLKDLHTRCGTFCNTALIELVELKDGDVLTIGTTRIQVAVQFPEPTEADEGEASVDDPTILPMSVTMGLMHTDQLWKVRESVVLIGRHPTALIHLDHQEVAKRHAVLFRFDGGAAIFDLCGGRGVSVNGRFVSGAALHHGDRVTVGPFGLQVDIPGEAALASSTPAVEPPMPPSTPEGLAPAVAIVEAPSSPLRPAFASQPCAEPDPLAEVSLLSSKLQTLRAQITDSWSKLNTWSGPPTEEAGPLGKANTDAASREAQLEAKDALLRGQLHDIQRYHEQLAERDREIQKQLASLEVREKDLLEAQAAGVQRETDLVRRAEELSRREHVVAQRWSRMMSTTCAHCGQKLAGTDDSSTFSAS